MLTICRCLRDVNESSRIEDLFSQIDVETKFLTMIYTCAILLYSLAIVLLTTFLQACVYVNLILLYIFWSAFLILFNIWIFEIEQATCDFIENFFVICKAENFSNYEKNCAGGIANISEENLYLKHRTAMRRGKADWYMRKGKIFLITIMLLTYFVSIKIVSLSLSLSPGTPVTNLARGSDGCAFMRAMSDISRKKYDKMSPTWGKSMIGLETHIWCYEYWTIWISNFAKIIRICITSRIKRPCIFCLLDRIIFVIFFF